MKAPDLNHIVETFVRLPSSSNPQWWEEYMNVLRFQVLPLISDLREKNLIGWYSFLLHDKGSGVPTTVGDDAPYVHLRLESLIAEEQVMRELPGYCRMTQQMRKPAPPSLDTVDIYSLRNNNVEEGWAVLGEMSELVLKMLDCHDESRPVPRQNIAQFLHYLLNQLQAQFLGFKEPWEE